MGPGGAGLPRVLLTGARLAFAILSGELYCLYSRRLVLGETVGRRLKMGHGVSGSPLSVINQELTQRVCSF